MGDVEADMSTDLPKLSLFSGLSVFSQMTRSDPERLVRPLQRGRSVLVIGGLRPGDPSEPIAPSSLPVEYKLFAVLPKPISLRVPGELGERISKIHQGFEMLPPMGVYKFELQTIDSPEKFPQEFRVYPEPKNQEPGMRLEPSEVPAVVVTPRRMEYDTITRIQDILDELVFRHYQELAPVVFSTMGFFRLYQGEQAETGTAFRNQIFMGVLPAWHPYSDDSIYSEYLSPRLPGMSRNIGESSYMLFTRLGETGGIVAPAEGAYEIDLERGELVGEERGVRVSIPSKLVTPAVSVQDKPQWFAYELQRMSEIHRSGEEHLQILPAFGIRGLVSLLLTESPCGYYGGFSCVSADRGLSELDFEKLAFYPFQPEPMLWLGAAKPGGKFSQLSALPYATREVVFPTLSGHILGSTAYRLQEIGGFAVSERTRRQLERQMRFQMTQRGILPVQVLPSDPTKFFGLDSGAAGGSVSEDIRFLSPSVSAAVLIRTGGTLSRVFGTTFYRAGSIGEVANEFMDYKTTSAVPYLDTLAIPTILTSEGVLKREGLQGNIIGSSDTERADTHPNLSNYMLGFVFPEALSAVVKRHPELFEGIYGGVSTEKTKSALEELGSSIFPSIALERLATTLSASTGLKFTLKPGGGERLFMIPLFSKLEQENMHLLSPEYFPSVSRSGVGWVDWKNLGWRQNVSSQYELVVPLNLYIKKAVKGSEQSSKSVYLERSPFVGNEVHSLSQSLQIYLSHIRRKFPEFYLLFTAPSGAELPDWAGVSYSEYSNIFYIKPQDIKEIDPKDLEKGLFIPVGAARPDRVMDIMQSINPASFYLSLANVIRPGADLNEGSFHIPERLIYGELALSQMKTPHKRSLLSILGAMAGMHKHLLLEDPIPGAFPLDEDFYMKLRESYQHVVGPASAREVLRIFSLPALFAFESGVLSLERLGSIDVDDIENIAPVAPGGQRPNLSRRNLQFSLLPITASIIDVLSGGRERGFAQQFLQLGGVAARLQSAAFERQTMSPNITERLTRPEVPLTIETASLFTVRRQKEISVIQSGSNPSQETQAIDKEIEQKFRGVLSSSDWRSGFVAAGGQFVPLFFEGAPIETGALGQELLLPVFGDKSMVRWNVEPQIEAPKGLFLAALAAQNFSRDLLYTREDTAGFSRQLGLPFGTYLKILPIVTTANQRVDLLRFMRGETYRAGIPIPFSLDLNTFWSRPTSAPRHILLSPENVELLSRLLGGKAVFSSPPTTGINDYTVKQFLSFRSFLGSDVPLPEEIMPHLQRVLPESAEIDLSEVGVSMKRPVGLVTFLPTEAFPASMPFGSEVYATGVGGSLAAAESPFYPKKLMVVYPGEGEEQIPTIARHIVNTMESHTKERIEEYPSPMFRIYKIQSGTFSPKEVSRQKPLAWIGDYIKKAFGRPMKIEEALARLPSKISSMVGKTEPQMLVTAFGSAGMNFSDPAVLSGIIGQAKQAVRGAGVDVSVSLLVAHPNIGQTYDQELFRRLPLISPYTVSALEKVNPDFLKQFYSYTGGVVAPIGFLVGSESWQQQILEGLRSRIWTHYEQSVPAFLGAIAATKSGESNILGMMPVAVQGPPQGLITPSLSPIAVRSLFATMSPSGTLGTIREGFLPGPSALRSVFGENVEALGQLGFDYDSTVADVEAPGQTRTFIPEWYSKTVLDAWKQQVGAVPQQVRIRAESGKYALLSFVVNEVCGRTPISCLSRPERRFGITFGPQGLWFTGSPGRTVFPEKGRVEVGGAPPLLLFGSPKEEGSGRRPPHDIRATLLVSPAGFKSIEDIYGSALYEMSGDPQSAHTIREMLAETGARAYAQGGFIPARLLNYLDLYSRGVADILEPDTYLTSAASAEYAQKLLPLIESFTPISLGLGYEAAVYGALRGSAGTSDEVRARLRRERFPLDLGIGGDWRSADSKFWYLDYPMFAAIRVPGRPPSDPLRVSTAILTALEQKQPGTERIALAYNPLLLTSLLRRAQKEQRAGGGEIASRVVEYMKTALPEPPGKESWVGFVPLQSLPNLFGWQTIPPHVMAHSLPGKVEIVKLSRHPLVALRLDQ